MYRYGPKGGPSSVVRYLLSCPAWLLLTKICCPFMWSQHHAFLLSPSMLSFTKRTNFLLHCLIWEHKFTHRSSSVDLGSKLQETPMKQQDCTFCRRQQGRTYQKSTELSVVLSDEEEYRDPEMNARNGKWENVLTKPRPSHSFRDRTHNSRSARLEICACSCDYKRKADEDGLGVGYRQIKLGGGYVLHVQTCKRGSGRAGRRTDDFGHLPRGSRAACKSQPSKRHSSRE